LMLALSTVECNTRACAAMSISKLGLRQFLVKFHVDPRIVTYIITGLGIPTVEDFANRWEHHEHGTALQEDVVARVEPFRSNPQRRPSLIQAARLKTAWRRARGLAPECESTSHSAPSSNLIYSAAASLSTQATQQRYMLPKGTPYEQLQDISQRQDWNSEVIGQMLQKPFFNESGESAEQPVHEKSVVSLDVEGDDRSDGRVPKTILHVSYIFVLVYWFIGFLWGKLGEGWSLVDCMYFVAVTVTTVGYGDKTFLGGAGRSDVAKIFGGIYVFVGVIIISAAAGTILRALQAKAEARFKKMITENEDKMLAASKGTCDNRHFNLSAEIRGVFVDVSKGLIFVVAALAAGCTGMMYFQEEWSFSDAFYFCCVTMTTVGYGDLLPTNNGSKVFVTVYILCAFSVLASIMSEVGAIPFRIEELKKIDKCLSLLGDSLDKEELAALCAAEEIVRIRNEQQLAEAEEEPHVSRAEFAIWQLIKQGKLKMDDILRCMQTFDKLDFDGSGRLNQKDIDLFLQSEQDPMTA